MLRRYGIFILLAAITGILYGASVFFLDPSLSNLFITAFALTVIYFLFSILIARVLRRQIRDERTKYTSSKVLSVIETALFLVIAIRIWVPDPGTLLVSLGIIGAGVAIALQDVFRNFAGSVVILGTGMYSVGDRIEIDGTYGDIIDIGMMTTTLLEIRNWVKGDQATGRLVIVPNGKALNTTVCNYTKDHSFIWDEITIPVPYDSNWRKAVELIRGIVQPETEETTRIAEAEIERIGEMYYLPKRDIEPTVYLSLTDNWIELAVRYVVNVKERRIVRARISKGILEAFEKEPDIEISSTTSTVSVRQK